MDFTAGIVVKNTQIGTRTSIREKGALKICSNSLSIEYICHGYIRSDFLSAIAICDQEYPQREAFTMLTKIMADFSTKIPDDKWKQATQKDSIIYSELSGFLTQYQVFLLILIKFNFYFRIQRKST